MLLYERIKVRANQCASKKIVKFVTHNGWHGQNNLNASSIFTINGSHSEKDEAEEDDEPSAEILKQLMTSWQEYRSISVEYFLDKVAV